MGSPVPKQFLSLAGKPIIWHTINSFSEAIPDINIIVVLPEEHLTSGHELISSLGSFNSLTLISGGTNRFESVKKGLGKVTGDSLVMVHDGVRCLVSPTLIRRCRDIAILKGNAVPAIKAADSIRITTQGGNRPVDRNEVYLIQTPQTFQSRFILPAFEQEYDPSFTDEATVVEKTGVAINLVEGEPTNIKITRPVDLLIAEQIVAERSAAMR